MTNMTHRLYFDLPTVNLMVAATLASPDHSDSFTDSEDGTRTGPALMWVKDSGTYLMSNALPRLEGDVLYARTTPGARALVLDGKPDLYEVVADICGGDDFAEYLPLDDTLVTGLRGAAEHGDRWFVIEVEEGGGDSFGIMTVR